MTPLHQLFFSNEYKIIHDLKRNKFILPIQRTGSSSLNTWASNNNFPIYTSDNRIDIDTIDVYWREPISRYWSGTTKTFSNLLLDNQTDFEKILKQAYFIDTHQMPQFWFLLKVVHDYGCGIKFKFLNLHDLASVTPLYVNKTIKSNNFNLPSSFDDKLNLYMTPDIVIWNEMIDNTLTFDEILHRISKEEDYVQMAQQYTFYNRILSWQNHSTYRNLEKA